MVSTESYCDLIRTHYVDFWSKDYETVRFDKGPVGDLPQEFRVLRFKPFGGRKMWTYATQCMSRRVDGEGLEIHIFTNGKHDEVIEILVAAAHYHRTGVRLNVGHTVNFGQPWIIGSSCEYGLLSRPYLDGPQLEWLDKEGIRVRFLWLVPVSKSEVEYARRNGLDALETRFDSCPFDYTNPHRAPIV
jgi:hypothetical protein